MRALHFCMFNSWSFLGSFQHSRLIPFTVRIDGSACLYHGSKVFQRPLPALTTSISATSLEEFETLSSKSYSKWKECCQHQFQVFSEQWLFCGLWQGWQAAGVRHCKFCAVTLLRRSPDQVNNMCHSAFLVCLLWPACEGPILGYDGLVWHSWSYWFSTLVLIPENPLLSTVKVEHAPSLPGTV